MNKHSLIYLFTGNGKGKTSAALGIAVRAICAGFKVAWISWYKSSDWPISEKNLDKHLPIDFFLMGEGFYIKGKEKTKPLNKGGKVEDKKPEDIHCLASQLALKKAQELLSSQKYDVLVLDEINTALADKLLTLTQIKRLFSQKGKTHLVLTGRKASKDLISLVDLASEIKKSKHPYDKGIKAVKGLDF